MSRSKRTTAVDLWPDFEDDPVDTVASIAPLNSDHDTRSSGVAALETQEDEDERIDVVAPIVRRNNRQNSSEDEADITFATPLVAHLASDYFYNVTVIGKNPEIFREIDSTVRTKLLMRDQEYVDFIQMLMDKYRQPPAHISFVDRRLAGRQAVSRVVVLGEERYQVGDVIITAAGDDGLSPAPVMPKVANPVTVLTVGNYFWFGIILSINLGNHTAHTQWLHHGCKTVMEELAHPQELFLTTRCNNIPIQSILAKAKCTRVPPHDRPANLGRDEFFYSLQYDEVSGAFKDIAPEDYPAGQQLTLRECPLCIRAEERTNTQRCRQVQDDDNSTMLELGDTRLHLHDFVMIRATGGPRGVGPCSLGQVLSISYGRRHKQTNETLVTVRLLGRVMSLAVAGGLGSVSVFEDRDLFLSNDCVLVKSSELIGKCFVLRKESIRSLQFWLDASPLHFFASAKAATRDKASLHSLIPLSSSDLPMCNACMSDKLREMEELHLFKQEYSLLRTFDPFAGVGALVKGLVNVGAVKLTHAVEICSSTARTLRKNNPEAIVYNQCANAMFDYAVTREAGIDTKLKSLGNTPRRLPDPPRADEVDCLTAGFPCQPHSTLNMYKKAEDEKSDLILSALSWVDHLKPKYCLFENVQGFLDYRLNSQQDGRYTTQGGVERGGIKFLVRTLTALGYQVRFALLQAGHYGTPQSRIRFFMWAAQPGNPLPEFPRPTHDFPCRTSMPIKFPIGTTIAPVDCREGIYPLPFVTVKDAMDDLKRWHWQNPHKVYKRTARDREIEEREKQESLVVRCREGDPWCGLEGEIPYEHPPYSAFQARSRREVSKDIQHYTPCLKEEVVERVVNIDMKPNANFISLSSKPLLLEWQIANPLSANARGGFQSNYYGRLDENGYFNTTVTNVHPTAKQGKVLNPWCKRMVTVRELARSQGFLDSFVFYTVDKNVRSMHRQIGNAVPLPLAEALGRELMNSLFRKWKQDRMDVDD